MPRGVDQACLTGLGPGEASSPDHMLRLHRSPARARSANDLERRTDLLYGQLFVDQCAGAPLASHLPRLVAPCCTLAPACPISPVRALLLLAACAYTFLPATSPFTFPPSQPPSLTHIFSSSSSASSSACARVLPPRLPHRSHACLLHPCHHTPTPPFSAASHHYNHHHTSKFQ